GCIGDRKRGTKESTSTKQSQRRAPKKREAHKKLLFAYHPGVSIICVNYLRSSFTNQEGRTGTGKKLPIIRGRSRDNSTTSRECPSCTERHVEPSESDEDDDVPIAQRRRRLFQDNLNPNGEKGCIGDRKRGINESISTKQSQRRAPKKREAHKLVHKPGGPTGMRIKLPIIRGRSRDNSTAAHEGPSCTERHVEPSESDEDDDVPIAQIRRRLFQDDLNPNGVNVNEQDNAFPAHNPGPIIPPSADVEVLDYDFDRQ
ncbi:hypothetical protein S83_030007, partial [Arachis hypogaea]